MPFWPTTREPLSSSIQEPHVSPIQMNKVKSKVTLGSRSVQQTETRCNVNKGPALLKVFMCVDTAALNRTQRLHSRYPYVPVALKCWNI